MVTWGYLPLYSWQQRNVKIEFLNVTQGADIIPVEVKSGKRTKAKSLISYIECHDSACTIKLVGKVGGTDSIHLVVPLYYVGKINKLCGASEGKES